MYASPLATVHQVLTEKSSASLPLPLLLTGTVNSFTWMLYGSLVQNNYVFVPSILSLTLTILQLTLTQVYPRTPSPRRLKSAHQLASNLV
eukprot:NODE_3635_length_750_cov_76.005706_g3050_i0.p2 GENE.NODE_3635_length_750_cov_76.005706_g3050_i0~~NODE_3635_length_750_cov_76.005706_g3050_i0.p2  ORF type:complete len:90 (-),score=24.97 NODE_3635_length_750_cov_76.005706_g3050_i0:51-320(-)